MVDDPGCIGEQGDGQFLDAIDAGGICALLRRAVMEPDLIHSIALQEIDGMPRRGQGGMEFGDADAASRPGRSVISTRRTKKGWFTPQNASVRL